MTDICVLGTVIGGFNAFDMVWVMPQGGPNNASEVIATYTYEVAFRGNDYGYGDIPPQSSKGDYDDFQF